jgi:hypothetical protein
VLRSVKGRESFARVLEAEAVAGPGSPEPESVILDHESEPAVHHTSNDRDATTRGAVGDSVFDRILDQRLKDHVRHART